MTASTSLSAYDWIKQVPPSLFQEETGPLMGYPPEFPWEQFSQKLGKLLELENFSVKPQPFLERRDPSDVVAGFESRTLSLQASVAPAAGSLWWVMAEQDVDLLMSLLLTRQAHPEIPIDPDFKLGFYHFLALEVINTISELPYEKKLSVNLLQESTFPTNPVLTLDISFTVQERTIWGRLVFSTELQQSWKERYVDRTMQPKIAQNINQIVQLEAGRTSMTFSEIKQLSLGDFLILDSCAIELDGSGSVLLSVSGVPFFSGKLSNGSVKISELSVYHEVKTSMVNTNPGDESIKNNPQSNGSMNDETLEKLNEEDLNSNSEDWEDEDDSTETEEDENNHEDDSEFDYDDNEIEESEAEEEEVKESEIEDETQIDHEESEIEELGAPAKQQEKWPPLPEAPARQRKTPRMKNTDEQAKTFERPTDAEKKPLTPDTIPLSVVIEVGRIQMTMQKLLELQPGNMLDLNIHPEQGVDLVVNGRRVAKGELLRVGEILGVRILDIG